MKPGKIIYEQDHEGVGHVMVRNMGPEDAHIMMDYINELSREKTFITFQGEQLDIEKEQKYVHEVLERISKNSKVKLLLLLNNQLVGISEVALSARVSSHIGTLGLSLAKDARGKKLGRLLIDLVLQEAKHHLSGLRYIELTCFANNHVAQNLYQKVGFKEVARIPERILHRGEYVDEIIMHKKIK